MTQGRYNEAESLYQKEIELQKKLFGEEHLTIINCYANLALLYESQKRYSEAEAIYLKILGLRKLLYGTEHSSVVTTLNSLATVYAFQKKYKEAQDSCLAAQRILKSTNPGFLTSEEKTLELAKFKLM